MVLDGVMHVKYQKGGKSVSYLVQEAELVLRLGVQNLHLEKDHSFLSLFSGFAFGRDGEAG